MCGRTFALQRVAPFLEPFFVSMPALFPLRLVLVGFWYSGLLHELVCQPRSDMLSPMQTYLFFCGDILDVFAIFTNVNYIRFTLQFSLLNLHGCVGTLVCCIFMSNTANLLPLAHYLSCFHTGRVGSCGTAANFDRSHSLGEPSELGCYRANT